MSAKPFVIGLALVAGLASVAVIGTFCCCGLLVSHPGGFPPPSSNRPLTVPFNSRPLTVPAQSFTDDEELQHTDSTIHVTPAGEKNVHVNGYRKKNGTWVESHDRAAPGNAAHPKPRK